MLKHPEISFFFGALSLEKALIYIPTHPNYIYIHIPTHPHYSYNGISFQPAQICPGGSRNLLILDISEMEN